MNTIRVPEFILTQIKDYFDKHAPKEAGAYLLSGYYENNLGKHFVAREVLFPRDEEYFTQTEFRLEISPMTLNRMINYAESKKLTVILCHSHPNSENPTYSPSDDYGEKASAKTLYANLLEKPCASLLFGKKIIRGRIWEKNKEVPLEVDQIRIIGDSYFVHYLKNTELFELNETLYSRQILCFGKEGQQMLSTFHIGIVGLGGTGSCAAEQLIRMGIKKLTLVDMDKFESSNVTRLYGSKFNTKRMFKTHLVKNHLIQIKNDVNIIELRKNVHDKQILKKLTECDLIFSCVDRHTPRSVLNQLCYQYYIPVIDVGVGLDSQCNKIKNGTIRATLSSPGFPCMFCNDIINPDRLNEESLTKEEFEERVEENYIRGFTEEPSIINYTTTAAGMGLSLFLNFIFNLPSKGKLNQIMNPINFHCMNIISNKEECICQTILGMGSYHELFAPDHNEDNKEMSLFEKVQYYVMSRFNY